MKITAQDLKEMEIIDGIIPEVPGGAHHDCCTSKQFIERVLDKIIE